MATVSHTLGLTKEATDGLFVEIDPVLREITTLWWIFQNRQNSITYIFSHLRLNVVFIISFFFFAVHFSQNVKKSLICIMKRKSICYNPMSKPSKFLSRMEMWRRLQNQCTCYTFYSSSYGSVVLKDVLKTERCFWQ